MIRKEERIGGQRLILGDCREVMPLLGRFDAVVTDPPYGIDYGRAGGFSATHGWGQWRENVAWDRERPRPEIFTQILDISKEQIIWGGNYFADLLPPSMRWLSWDKGQRDFSLADIELAWTSQQKAARVFDFARGKAVRDGKQHPTQKPVALMEWCHRPAGELGRDLLAFAAAVRHRPERRAVRRDHRAVLLHVIRAGLDLARHFSEDPMTVWDAWNLNAHATARELAQDGEPAPGSTTEPENATCQPAGGFGDATWQAILTAIAAEKATWPHAGSPHEVAREACDNIASRIKQLMGDA